MSGHHHRQLKRKVKLTAFTHHPCRERIVPAALRLLVTGAVFLR